MRSRALTSDAILLLTAAIWGFAFAFQRIGMEHIGPFLYTALRFSLGAIVLAPMWRKNARRFPTVSLRRILIAGCFAGCFLFFGVTFQQVGIVYTTAGKAGFITGLYVVLVPIIGLFFHRRAHTGGWIGAILAIAGLYFLSVVGFASGGSGDSESINRGDLFVSASAFFWAAHVIVLDRYANHLPFIPFATTQYVFCALLSGVVAIFAAPIDLSKIFDAAIPILYGGAVSVGIAYTLQIVGQRSAPPTHAAIILSLEGVFAAIGGLIILGERLSPIEIAGCALMLGGMLVSQLTLRRSAVREN